MAYSPIGLNFPPERIAQRSFAPFQLDIRPLEQYIIAKIIRRWLVFHK
jgi:hypothetical protein